VAKSLGLDEVRSELSPEQKMETVAKLAERRGVLMVGDGINDAPALARSTVGVSMGQLSSATAREASDVVLLNNDLSLLVWLFAKSGQTQRIVRQNVSLALLSMAVGVSTALQGVLPLWMAVTIHEGSTLLVGLNALRLLAL
jgi:Zn2+/Cd2+-exporting ATPase